MKKGTLGTLTFILGIIIIVGGVVAGLAPTDSLLWKIARLPGIIGFIPVIVIGIIAIVKGSNRVKAIIGMVLAFFGTWIVSWLLQLISTLIK